MGSLKDRKSKEVSATEAAVLNITGKAQSAKTKYPVNVVFDGDIEVRIRQRAKDLGLGVATYIKMLVNKDLNS